MTRRRAQVVILCEDLQQEVFARRFLLRCGFHRRRIRSRIAPAGRGAGEQFVHRQYPQEVQTYRRKKEHLALRLVVIVDADTRTVDQRLEELDEALRRHRLASRASEEHIGIFVPKRNIETWIYYLQGVSVDEHTAYPKLPHEGDCAPAVKRLAEAVCHGHGLAADAPPSLRSACDEWTRIA